MPHSMIQVTSNTDNVQKKRGATQIIKNERHHLVRGVLLMSRSIIQVYTLNKARSSSDAHNVGLMRHSKGEREREREKKIRTVRHFRRETERQRDRETEGQRERETEGQRERKTEKGLSFLFLM